MEVVVVEKLRKNLTDKWGYGFQLGQVNLSLNPGEILSVSGPRSSGKTSLLRLIWGFTRPDYGKLEVFGMRPHLDQIKVRQRAGFMAQHIHFYETMSAPHYLRFISFFYDNWDFKAVIEGIEEFRIPLDVAIGHFTRGDRLKLGLLAATGHHPRLLILDDPLNEVEPIVRGPIVRHIRDLARKEGVAVVVSSEKGEDLDEIADQRMALKKGRVV